MCVCVCVCVCARVRVRMRAFWATTASSIMNGFAELAPHLSKLNMQVRTFEVDLAETCAERQCNVGLLAYSPLAGGSLSGKYIEGEQKGARLNMFPGSILALPTPPTPSSLPWFEPCDLP